MTNELILPLHRAVDKEYVKGRLKSVGPKGLDFDKAEELGVINRISNLMCAMHCLTTAAFRIFGEVDNLFNAIGVRKHDIKKACNDYENAFVRWARFWRDYQTVAGVMEMNSETEDFFLQFMRWAQLPVHWEFGQKQNCDSEREPMIEIDRNDRIWRLYRDVASSETIGEVKEEWAVMQADKLHGRSTMTCVKHGMDKASAQMSAKRMSANEKGCLFAACKMETYNEERVEIVPYKAYFDGEAIGDIKNMLKKKKV